jgi:hypothetical protein
VHFTVLAVVLCAALVAAASAVARCCLRGARRRERQRAEWEQVAPGLLELDDELDRMWAAEQEWLRRHR